MHPAVRVPATSANLGPGFDALGVAVARHLVAVSVERQSQRVVTQGQGADEVPEGDDNLLWRSLTAFCDRHGVAVPDVSVRVVNDIPLERGLGSSSAAIVAGLVLARSLTGVAAGDLDLVALATALEGHPDNVAPALLGGFVACATTPAGGLVVRRAQPTPAMALAVAVPPTRQNTNAARASLPDALSRTDVATQAARAVHSAAAFVGTWPADPSAATDLLHEPARFREMSASGALVDQLRADGVHAWLSGAGPTVAAAVRRADLPAQEAVAARARDHGFTPAVLEWDLAGALACPADGCAISSAHGCAICPRARL